jgi:murein DD-endopeptidase MepM/ murein hydrolase activator NlpD
MTNSSDAQALAAIRDCRLFPTRAPLKAAAVVAALISLLSSSFAAAQPAGVAQPPQQVAGFQGQGGPFEAVAPLKAGDPKFKQMFMSWKKLDRVEQGTIAIPSSMPVSGTNLTSGYGVRSDPFRGRAAMHAGIDLAGPVGTQIRATADGYVQRSEWVSGYGNLVELSHGRGIQTRYGHLSKSLVRPGQRVKRGDLIALMGSTGRSTGSHLHYEVRIDGKAVNPTPFMQGNDYLFALQRRVAAGSSQVAMGGPAGGGK